jgi:hypothetical protein
MTSQVVEPVFVKQATVAMSGTGRTLGVMLGGLYLLWTLCVISGVAQSLMDFISWLHFTGPVYVIEDIDPMRATALVLLTGAVGYVMGGVFAFCWNRVHCSHC